MPRLACLLTVAAAVLWSVSGASLVPSAADVPLDVGSPLHLDCGVTGHHRHCLWESPDGRVFQVEDVHLGRHAGLRAPHNLTHNQCGLVVERGAAGDAGTWTCQVFLAGEALTSVKNVRKEGKACRPPFVSVGTSCYYINIGLKLPWSDARTFCHTLSAEADLAILDDCYEFQLLWGHIVVEYGPTYVWLGGTDEHQDNQWRWVDGTPITMGTPFWAPGEPNDIGDTEGCLTISSSTGYFNDLTCDRPYVSLLCQDFV